ncbi:MAG: CRISPR-associated endonuclease Cas1 [Methanothrix sp.]|nr:CRISPR-associated endonuclease Cas1 [Methanothrix sp.]
MPELVPAGMISEFAYCPRQCYIRSTEGEFIECEDAAEGNQSDKKPKPIESRSVYLSGPVLGVTCRLNLLEGEGRNAIPVEYKKGEAPNVPGEVYESDRVKLCAQGLVLRENGFLCDEGLAYFAKSKKPVPVKFDESLVQRTREIIAQIRQMISEGKMPPPLVDSPKCIRCSFGGICLPDEVNFLRENKESPTKELRMLLPARDDRVPVYVLDQGCSIHKRGDCLEIRSRDGKISSARIMEISQVCLYGGVEISTPAVVELMQRGIPVLHFTHGGWFEGICLGHTNKNIELRIRQFEWAGDPEKSLAIARSMVSGKIKNCRILLRRNDEEVAKDVLDRLADYAREAETSPSFESLLGFEGAAAELYFSRLGSLLKTNDPELSFQGRNRRPPKDPVNAVLSYLYGILAKETFVTLLAVGFEPYLGFYHQPRYGRPALALDLMEEFRPLIADSVAITLFNNKELVSRDFIRTDPGVMLTPSARRKVVAGYERRVDTEVTHPLFGYKISYRRVMEVQSRLLSRTIFEEIGGYPAFCTR